MKKSGFILLLSVINFCSFIAKGQSVVPGSDALLDKLRLNKALGNNEVSYSSIDGNPFLFKDFKKAKLVLTSGENFDINVRFDLYGNTMHVLENGLVYAIGYPEKIKRVDVDTLTIIYSTYQKSGTGSYFILKTEGECSLLIKRNIRLQDAELPKPYQEGKPARFIYKDDAFYLKLGEEPAALIRSKSDILLVLKNHEAEMNNYLSTNKVNIRKVEDLQKLIVYYNSL